ncbi:5'-methylthioadenosine/S-adenosylhomocysteine nucleosidase [Halomonas elongata]|uniref:5'-methylthioadenosine/S-adenosylhomocysteine nucleosidase n=1 Tax=Halomonas elongata TaxID=2746 RepID=UPI004033B040
MLLRIPGIREATLSTGADIVSGAAYDAIDADMVDMESYACLRACTRFGVPLVVLRGISDGKAELHHVDDWTEYLHVIDEKLAHAVNRLGEAIGQELLLHRLQRMGLIDVHRWYLYSVIAKYYGILLEELTDRIAIRMLDNVQQELRAGDGLSAPVIERVVEPRKQALIREISQRLEGLTSTISTCSKSTNPSRLSGLRRSISSASAASGLT